MFCCSKKAKNKRKATTQAQDLVAQAGAAAAPPAGLPASGHEARPGSASRSRWRSWPGSPRREPETLR